MDNSIKRIINALPPLYRLESYDPVLYIYLTNKLIPYGKGKVISFLKEFIYRDIFHDGSSTLLLLRILFDLPRKQTYFPDMFAGAIMPPNYNNKSLSPRYPIILYKDMPILMAVELISGGGIQPVAEHLKYYEKNCELRTSLLRPPMHCQSLEASIRVLPQWVFVSQPHSVIELGNLALRRQLRRIQSVYG